MRMFFLICCLASTTVIEASHAVSPKEHKAIVQEACLCAECNPWWCLSWLFPTQLHPLSPVEESAVKALDTSPLAVSIGNGKIGPLLEIIFDYIGDEVGTNKERFPWRIQET